ncbi:MAG: hypothetical protein MUP70_08715 [Candidatus Aminicenantes bacterium]|nr:hypothetical protein [Candidatus Aminicenantes bacterium]
MISVAKIPWRKSFFIGFIAFISLQGKTEVFATYNGSKISFLKRIDESSTEIRIVKGSKRLTSLISKSISSVLKAPVGGQMINSIKESLDSGVDIEYIDGKGRIYTDSGRRAGYEETERIFSYF